MAINVAEPALPNVPLDHNSVPIVLAYNPPTANIVDITAGDDVTLHSQIATAASSTHIKCPISLPYTRSQWSDQTVRNRTDWVYVTPDDAAMATLNTQVPFGYRVKEQHASFLARFEASIFSTGGAVAFRYGSTPMSATRGEARYLWFSGIHFVLTAVSNATGNVELWRNDADIIVFDRCLFSRAEENWNNKGRGIIAVGFDQIYHGCTVTGCALRNEGSENASLNLTTRQGRTKVINCHFDKACESVYITSLGSGVYPANKNADDILIDGCTIDDKYGKYNYKAQEPPLTAFLYDKPDIDSDTVTSVSGDTIVNISGTIAGLPTGASSTYLASFNEGTGIRESVRTIASYDGAQQITVNTTGANLTYQNGDTIKVYNNRFTKSFQKNCFEIKNGCSRVRMRRTWIGNNYGGGEDNLIRLTINPNDGNGGQWGDPKDILFDDCMFDNSWDEAQFLWYMRSWQNHVANPGDPLGLKRVLFRSCAFLDAHQAPTGGDHNLNFQFASSPATEPCNPDNDTQDVGFEHCITYYRNRARVKSGVVLIGDGVAQGSGGFLDLGLQGPFTITNCIFDCNGKNSAAVSDLPGYSNPQTLLNQVLTGAGRAGWTYKGNAIINPSDHTKASPNIWTDATGVGSDVPTVIDAADGAYPGSVYQSADPGADYDFTIAATSPVKGKGQGAVDPGLIDPSAFKAAIDKAIAGEPQSATSTTTKTLLLFK